MSFELVYISKAGNHSYWTRNHNFSKKIDNHFQWAQIKEIQVQLLAKKYPTIFQNKNDQRFSVLNTDTNDLQPLPNSSDPDFDHEHAIPNVTKQRPYPQAVITQAIQKQLDTGKKSFVIVTVVDQSFQYLDTTQKNHGDFVPILNKQVRRWDDSTKAIKTAETLYKNQKFWKECSNVEDKLLCVLDAKKDIVIWSSDDPNIQLNPTAQLLAQLQQLDTQLQKHFHPTDDSDIDDDNSMMKQGPDLNLGGIDAPHVFEALEYLIHALTWREKVNQLLNYYDKRILQDQLHTVELTDLSHFKAKDFIEYLQRSRRNRRQIKDLSIILDCLADNMDADAILAGLKNHPSLHNHYCYRDQATAEMMKKLSC